MAVILTTRVFGVRESHACVMNEKDAIEFSHLCESTGGIHSAYSLIIVSWY